MDTHTGPPFPSSTHTYLCTCLDEHHESAGQEGHVDQGAERDEPAQRRALGQEGLCVCVYEYVWTGEIDVYKKTYICMYMCV
jgi:hypothetical protein